MTLDGQYVRYVVESDKAGPYVLPEGYVGASGHAFVVRRNGYPLKLRLDAASHPHSVELTDDGPGDVFSFQRTDDR
jgi:hypothetical protein